MLYSLFKIWNSPQLIIYKVLNCLSTCIFKTFSEFENKVSDKIDPFTIMWMWNELETVWFINQQRFSGDNEVTFIV